MQTRASSYCRSLMALFFDSRTSWGEEGIREPWPGPPGGHPHREGLPWGGLRVRPQCVSAPQTPRGPNLRPSRTPEPGHATLATPETPVRVTHSFCDTSQVREQWVEAQLWAGFLTGAVRPSGPWAPRPCLSFPSGARCLGQPALGECHRQLRTLEGTDAQPVLRRASQGSLPTTCHTGHCGLASRPPWSLPTQLSVQADGNYGLS